MKKSKNLGKGLSSLIGDMNLDIRTVEEERASKISYLKLEDVAVNANQPRKEFCDISLEELTQSIKSKGIISPIIVRDVGGKYEVIAGERRYRAAAAAGVEKIPAIVKNVKQNEVLEIALIENIQRQDLNPVEESEAYKTLMETCSYTQQDIATIVGKSRSYITNLLRLLSLSPEILSYLKDKKITMGHARALIGERKAESLARKIIKQNLNVRQIEKLIKSGKIKEIISKRPDGQLDEFLADIRIIEELLQQKLQTKVLVKQSATANKGHLHVEYRSLEELDRLLQLLSKQ